MTAVSRILVVELLGGLGDLLLALPAVHALARSHPGAELDVLTFAPGDTLLVHDPAVARFLTVSDHTPGAAALAVEKALTAGYDLVVTTTTYDGIAALCRERAPWAVTDLWQGAPDGEPVDRRFLRLLAAAGAIDASAIETSLQVVLTDDERSAGRARLHGLAPNGSPVVLVPRSGMRVKEWGDERWLGLAQRLRAAGRPVLCSVADPDDGLDGVPALPPADLRGLAAAYAAVGERGGVVVGGDTGPVRLAAAVGARTVGLFGATSAGRYGVTAPGARSLQGWAGCPVRMPSAITEQECWWSARCPFGSEPQCMADLPLDLVAEAVLGQPEVW